MRSSSFLVQCRLNIVSRLTCGPYCTHNDGCHILGSHFLGHFFATGTKKLNHANRLSSDRGVSRLLRQNQAPSVACTWGFFRAHRLARAALTAQRPAAKPPIPCAPTRPAC